MASFLGGLGQGLGAIGAGVGRGELLGTQQAERMHQQKAMADYRAALLAAQQQKATGAAHNQDIAHAVRLQAAIEQKLNDREAQADLRNNPGLLTRLLARHRDLNEVIAGRSSLSDLPPDNIVDNLASFGIGGGLGAGVGLGAGGGATTPGAGPPTPPPQLNLSGAIAGIGRPGAPSLETPGRIAGIGAPPTPPQRGPGLNLPPNNMGAPPQFALGGAAPPPQPIGPPTPSDIVNRQISSRVFGAQAPEPPSPVEETAATAPPAQPEPPPQLSPAEQIGADYNKGPGPASGGPPGETLKQFGIRMKGRSSALGLNLKEILADPQVRALNAQADRNRAEAGLTEQKSAAFPEVTKAGLARTRAQTGLAGAQQRQIEALTPERVNQIRNTITKQSADVLIATRNAQTAIDRLNEAGRHNRATEDYQNRSLKSQDALRQKQIAHINFVIDNGDALKMSDSQKLQARQLMQVISAVDRDAAGVAHPHYAPDVVKRATDQINDLYRSLKLKPIFAATAASSQPAGQAGLGNVTSGGAATVTPAMRAAIGPHIKSGTVHQYYQNAPSPQVQAQIRAAYEAITHQPWPG